MDNMYTSINNILKRVENQIEKDQHQAALDSIRNARELLSGNLNPKELSVWAYLNEAEFYLEHSQNQQALNNILIACDILAGARCGDFEYGFIRRD